MQEGIDRDKLPVRLYFIQKYIDASSAKSGFVKSSTKPETVWSFFSELYTFTHAEGNTSDSACARLIVIGSFVFPRIRMASRTIAFLSANGPCD